MSQLFSTSKRSCLSLQKQSASVSLLSSRFDPETSMSDGAEAVIFIFITCVVKP